MSIISTLNNRELATAIWVIIFLIWALSRSQMRTPIINLLKAFFVWKLVFPLVIMFLYIFFVVIFFQEVNLWDTSALKDTILWTAGTAVATYFSLNRVSADEGLFKVAISDNIKFTLILEFILNVYSFSLVGELILIPVLTFTVMLHTYAGLKTEYKQVKTLLDYVLGIFGIFLIVFTFRQVIIDFQNFATLKTLRDLLLPPLFSIMIVPFLYIMALFIQYENIFVRVDIANKKSDFAKSVKKRIFQTCHLNLSKLHRFSKNVGYPKVSSVGEVETLIKRGLGKTTAK